jgi:hypothetical protein
MATYVLAYKGGGMPETDAEREVAMQAWGTFLGGLGNAVVDAGNPFGAAKTVSSGGSVADGASSGLNGYSIITANDLSAAASAAKGCPILQAGGSVEVHEIFPVM